MTTLKENTESIRALCEKIANLPKNVYDEAYAEGYAEAENRWKPYDREVKCLVLNGKQYLDTAFKPDQNTRVVFSGELHSVIDAHWLYGVRKSSAVDCFGAILAYDTSINMWYGTNSKVTTIPQLNQRFTIDQNKNQTTITYADGTVTSVITNTEQEFTSTYNLYLGSISLAMATANERTSFHGGMYPCKVYDGDILVRDYIPVIDKKGVACAYDKVSGGLFYSGSDTPFGYEE